ncbi:cutinase family protein [Cellulomonas sp. S1-8]|uniref:cutinase family protein n=1 Tax=Cellulomonas sp. S1-8 TaxID=2904790 RepID=UPI0022443AB6|nr:cutinase family protein [Cellulomonas sp. S1-8]UZN02850.1 cutinase family protein [Cellulomonas sp. S1-8]
MQLPRPRRVLAATVAAVAALTTVTTAATGAAAATACPDVELVFARGTGEAAGLGIVGRPLERALAAELPGRSVVATAVDYAASSSQASAGPGSGDMVAKVQARAAACPATQFVLGGYSQGATVTDLALGIRTGVTAGTALPADLAPRVAAVVVYGNPLGLSRRTIAQAAPTFAARAVEFCNSGDPVCESGGGRFSAHLTYATNGTVTQGAQFAARLIGSGAPVPTPTGTAAPTPAPTTPAPGAGCVTASTRQHVRDGRAVAVWLRTYARGSRDALGLLSSRNEVALQLSDADTWSLVASC